MQRLALFLLLTVPLLAQGRKEPAVYSRPHGDVARMSPPSVRFGLKALDPVRLAGLTRAPRAPRQVGVHRAVSAEVVGQGAWESLADGRRIWRLAIRSPQAAGVRIQFGDFSVGSGEVWVGENGPYSGGGPYGNGEFWSGGVSGDTATLEYIPSAGADEAGDPPFTLRLVAHQLVEVGKSVQDPAASCNLDVNCYADWAESAKSVAHLVFEVTDGDAPGTYVCSGSLVATRDNSFKPYLMTAAHCIGTEAQARSLQTYWAYRSSFCGAGAPADKGSLNSTNGGHLLGSGGINLGDYSLVLLPDAPDGVVFSGWDPAELGLTVSVTGIHHPRGSYKRISFGHTVGSAGVYLEGFSAGSNLYTTVAFDKGITEPGSSGSPLFEAPGVIVGSLTYGPGLPGEELCAAGDYGAYGKFSVAYNALSNYFENLPAAIVKPSQDTVRFTGLNGQIAGGTSQTIQLTTDAASPEEFKIRTDAGWVQAVAGSGTVSSGVPTRLTITIMPGYLTGNQTYSTTVAILSGAAPPQYVNVKADMRADRSNVAPSASPNPVRAADGARWTVNLTLEETAGVATKVTGFKIDAIDYSSQIAAFFGGDTIPASGTIQAELSTSGLVPPVTKYFDFIGLDKSSGQSWHRVLAVKFE